MKVGGQYIVISYGDPDSRVFHLQREFLAWNIRQYKLFYKEDQEIKEENKDGKEDEDPKVHYIYVCTKRADADRTSKLFFKMVLKQLLIEENKEQEYLLKEAPQLSSKNDDYQQESNPKA